MEDNIQTIIAVIISAFLLFIFPVYMAYEKKDDISYALAMRYTQDLVDNVRSKGYISKDMYEDYRAKLKLTGNSYDIEMTHEYNRYDPITNYYTIKDQKYTLVKTSTREEKEEYERTVIEQAMQLGKLKSKASQTEIDAYLDTNYELQSIHKVEDTYKLSTEVYTTGHIVGVLNGERKLLLNSDGSEVICSDDAKSNDNCQYAYIMNVDDNFNITIKNTNITLATVIYNMVTANTLDSNTRIYVNYGGSILSSKWYGDIDYAKMKHDTLRLTENGIKETIILTDARHYEKGKDMPSVYIPVSNNENTRYIIEFEAKPEATTELREKGNIQLDKYSGYNFALGNSKINNTADRLSISVGVNGVSLIVASESSMSNGSKFYLPLYDQIIVDEAGNESKIETKRKVTDYISLRLYYENGYLKIKATGKQNVEDYDEKSFLAPYMREYYSKLDVIINNPKKGITHNTATYTTSSGLKTRYKIEVGEESLWVEAFGNKIKRDTILSYATSINDYAKIKVEFVKKESGLYVAYLYINGVKVGESIEMETIPKPDVVGMSIIGTESQSFLGYIRNVKIYEMGD